MDMIRHDDELIDLDIRIKVGHVFQLFPDSLPISGVSYQNIPRTAIGADIAKDLLFLLGTDGDEIIAGRIIIIVFQTDAFSFW